MRAKAQINVRGNHDRFGAGLTSGAWVQSGGAGGGDMDAR